MLSAVSRRTAGGTSTVPKSDGSKPPAIQLQHDQLTGGLLQRLIEQRQEARQFRVQFDHHAAHHRASHATIVRRQIVPIVPLVVEGACVWHDDGTRSPQPKGRINAMQLVRPDDLPSSDLPWPPTEDDLPCSDGVPMETPRHRQQMHLLIDTLNLHWASRQDFYTGGDMFLYFSVEQIRGRDFRGPDFFVVLGVSNRERKSWVVWQEGKGPDLIVELLSESTAAIDKGEKKQIYQDVLQVPEYIWYDPFSGELAGFRLHEGRYQAIEPDAAGRLASERLGLSLVRWAGSHAGIEAVWLRWATAEGRILPTPAEHAEAERQRAELAERRIAELEARLARLEARLGQDPDGQG